MGVLATTSTMDQETAELCFYALAGLTYEIRVLVAGVERDLVDDSGTRRPAQRGPFRVTRILMVEVATSEVVAISTR